MADVDFLGTLAPPSGGSLPITRGEYIMGAVKVVANAAARDAIASTQLRTKDLCLLADTGLWYQWSGASWGAYTGFGGGGAGGGIGFPFTFSTTTTDSDPGNGTLRANHATLASATQLFVDIEEFGGTDVSDWLDQIDDYVGAVKGIIRLQSRSDSDLWIEYTVTGTPTGTGYRKLPVVYKDGPGGLLTTAGDTFLSFDAVGVPSNLNNQALTGARTIAYNGEVDNGNSSTADTIDWTTGSLQKSTLTGNCTYTFTAPTAFTGVQFRIVQDATGGRTATFPGSVVWTTGVAPTIAAGPNEETIISGYYDGTNYRLSADDDRATRVVAQNATTYTTVSTDAFALLENNNASPITVTIPPNSSVAYRIGVTILFAQTGAGQVTLAAGAGVTLKTNTTLKTVAQEAMIGATKIATNTWRVFGDRAFS